MDKNTNQWIEHYRYYNSHDGYISTFLLKQEYAYNVNGNMTLNITCNWDETAHLFVYNTRTTSYYSDKSTNSIPDTPTPHLTVYPNPAKDFVVFDLPNSSESASVELFDIQGKKVVQQKLTETKQIAVGHLPKGLYLYRLTDMETVYTGKLVVE